jgi:hypothetical protein
MPNAGVNLGRIIGKSSPGQVLTADADGEKMSWEDAGGGLPVWFQTGSGSPIGTITPNTVGGLYFDTSGATGLWSSYGATNVDWVQLGSVYDGQHGLTLGKVADGKVNIVLASVGAATFVEIRSGSGSSFAVVSDTRVLINTPTVDLSGVILLNQVTVALDGVFFPLQAPTTGGPAWILGGMYFDTTLNKLRIGGASGWETVTSV